MSEFSCDGPGIGELMASFEAALGPLAVGIELALDPSLSGDVDWAAENLDAAMAMMVPAAAFALALVDVLEVVVNLPPMPAPFNVGAPSLEGWDPTVQGVALAATLTAMIEIPISLMIGLFEGQSFEFPDIVVELLPDIPGVEGLAGCITDVVEPIFGG